MNKHRQPTQYANKLFAKAAEKLQQGDAANAKKGLLKVAKLVPDSAAVWYNLGLCNQYLGQHQHAVDAYQRALKITPNQVEGWVNIGISQKELGLSSEAEASVLKAINLQPTHARALNLLGSIEAERGEYEAARAKLNQSLITHPENRDAKINLANLEIQHNNYDQALEIIEELNKNEPNEKEFIELKTKVLLNMGRNEEASLLILELRQVNPDDEGTLYLELNLKEAIRDHFGVIKVAEKLLKVHPEDASLWNSLGGAYFQLDSIEKAKVCYEKAIELEPEHAEYENNVGLTFSSLGDRQNAELHYRRSIELNPLHAEAYRNIATMKRFGSMEDVDAMSIKALWEREDLDDLARIKASFALGKVYDDCGLYDQAFKVYKEGNDLKFKESKIDLAAYFAHIDRIPAVFDRLPDVVNTSQASPEPIFILGMPRSGTTLVEQIISRHSDVHGCGELPCIERAINRLEKKAEPMRVYPNDFWQLEAHELEREGAEYLDWVNLLHDMNTPYFTDKMPFNFVHVWLIKAMFPNAPIVHCERHPLDVITSNYFQLYGSDISFVYQLEALANYTIRYHRLMQHWRSLFGDGVYTVRYESLVSDPENETKRLIKAINLDWQDNCLQQKTSKTAVRTASIWQVRQGIHTRSKARWRHYEAQYQGIIKQLADAGILDRNGDWLV